MENIFLRYKNWQYKNTTLLVLSLVILIYFADSDFVKNIISKIGDLGYLGAFIVGIFFVSTFTVALALVVLYFLAGKYNPYAVAVLAGAGAVVGDYIIFAFMKDRVFEEIKPLFAGLRWSGFFKKIFQTPYFSWLLPVAGAIIVASPLPDEVGISIMGISKIKKWQFVVVSFLLNAVGIFLTVAAARYFTAI